MTELFKPVDFLVTLINNVELTRSQRKMLIANLMRSDHADPFYVHDILNDVLFIQQWPQLVRLLAPGAATVVPDDSIEFEHPAVACAWCQRVYEQTVPPSMPPYCGTCGKKQQALSAAREGE